MKMYLSEDTLEFKIPVWAMYALEYADNSGLSDDDIDSLDAFEDDLLERADAINATYSIEQISEASYFSMSNDVDLLGNDVYDVRICFYTKG